MFCSNCGKEIPDGSEFCPYCGTNLNEEIKKEKTEVVEEVKENICNNCNKEIPEESEFCPYCGYNLKDNIPSTDIENDSIAYENEIETTTKTPMKSKVVIIIIVIVGIVTIASYNAWKIYEKANNSLNSFNNQLSETNDNKKEDIPEEERVTISFIEGMGERKYEDRRISNRTRLLDCVSDNDSNVRADILSKNLGVVYESAGGIFYFECDSNLNSKITKYGSIIFFNYIKNTGGSTYFTTIATIWSASTPYYSVAYTQKMARDVRPELATVIRDNKMMTVINDYYSRILRDFNISNVRIGLIESNTNEYWMKEYANLKKNDNTQDNSSEEDNNTNKEGNNNTNKEETTLKTEKTEYSHPEISIKNTDTEVSTENLELEYIVRDEYDKKVDVSIKNNGKEIKKQTININTNIKVNIKLTEGTNNIEIVTKNSKGKNGSDKCTVKLEYSKPTISITSNWMTYTEENIYNLAYSIYDKYDKKVKMIIKNNGKVIVNRMETSEEYSSGIYELELVKGKNNIEIIVTNSKGKTNSAKHTITKGD